VGDSKFIDILQLVAKTYASGDGGNLNIGEGLKTILKIEERGLALDRGRYSHDDLTYLARKKFVAQQVYLQVGRTYALHRRDNAAEDMIHAMILTCILDRHKVGNLLDNANRRAVTARIAAYRTERLIRKVITALAVAYVVAEASYAI
jgi:hypothetical protein